MFFEVILMISKNNTRTLITLSKDLKTQLEILAKKENGSLSNYIMTVLQKHLETQ